MIKVEEFIQDYPDYCIKILEDYAENNKKCSRSLDNYRIVIREFYVNHVPLLNLVNKYDIPFGTIYTIPKSISKIIHDYINYNDDVIIPQEQDIININDNDVFDPEKFVIDHILLKEELIEYINRADLNDKEKNIIERLYNLEGDSEQNLAKIGRELNLSRSRIGYILDKAMYKIREGYRKSYNQTRGYGTFHLVKARNMYELSYYYGKVDLL